MKTEDTEPFDPSLRQGDRGRFQFTLRQVFLFTAVIASIAAFAARFPTIVLIVLFVTCSLCLVAVYLAVTLAEGVFWDWLDSKLRSDDDTRDET